MKTKHVIVEKYDPSWENSFALISSQLMSAVEGKVFRIEHVGSTSVKGLSAKPIIDIDIVIESDSFEAVKTALGSIGYCHEGDLGIAGREAFKYRGEEPLPLHHLYVCAEGSAELGRHIAFRNYLRSHPEAVKEYSRVKEEGARLYPYDIDSYINHKSPFIERIYKELGI